MPKKVLFEEKDIHILKLAQTYKAKKILFYYLHFIQKKLKHIISSEFFQVDALLLVDKNGDYNKDGPPTLEFLL